MNARPPAARSNRSFLASRLERAIVRAELGRWLARLRIAEAIVWLAAFEAEALSQAWEFFRCVVSQCA